MLKGLLPSKVRVGQIEGVTGTEHLGWKMLCLPWPCLLTLVRPATARLLLFLCVKKLSDNLIQGWEDGLKTVLLSAFTRWERANCGPREATWSVGALSGSSVPQPPLLCLFFTEGLAGGCGDIFNGHAGHPKTVESLILYLLIHSYWLYLHNTTSQCICLFFKSICFFQLHYHNYNNSLLRA